MSDYLLLGPVAFEGFELPPQISFGGRQRLVVHTLPGGVRVIDAMGRDDADISWSGAFAGADAADRARLLDLLRAEGGTLSLAWDAFCYLVVIDTFEAEYQHVNWIPYRIACKVIADQTQPPINAIASLATSLVSDLTAAASGVDVTAALAAVSGALSPGSAAFAAAVASVTSVQAQITGGIASAGASLMVAPDPGTAATAAGSLATLADANGYVGRALVNLDDAGM